MIKINRIQTNLTKYIVLVFGFIVLSTFSFAGNNQHPNPETTKSIFDLTNYTEILEVDLEFNVKEMLSDRRSQESFKGKFSFLDEHGQQQEWKAKINLRGKFRRSKCKEMPPLKLNFKKGDLENAGLTRHDDFKLVTQCVEDEKDAKEFLLKEYLVYKMYNTLTEYSFRVQFLKINLKDSKTGETETQWGFIIEDNAQLRTRVNAAKFEGMFNVKNELFNKQFAKQVGLFQYMIGNLDWNYTKKLHNVKAIRKEGELILVPYDFDFSAIVSTSYATLNSNYKVNSLKDRLYLGQEKDLEEMEETINHFKSKKKEIVSLVKSFKPLKKSSRREIIEYINDFYSNIDNIQTPGMMSTVSTEK